METALLTFYFLWLIVLITGLVLWIPKYVKEEDQDITISFTILGFTFISMTMKFISRVLKGEANSVYIGLYLLSVAILLAAITGVYYWFPKYFPQGIPDPVSGKFSKKYSETVLVACFTVTLIFINLYDREYSEGVYKSGEVMSALVNYGGKRKHR